MLVRLLTQSLKIISIVALTAIIVAGSVSFFNYWTDRERPENIGRPVTFTITEEDDGGSVAGKLTDAGLIDYGWFFDMRFRFAGVDFQPGTYTLRHGMSASDIIEAVSVPTDDDPEATITPPGEALQITFIEGERIEQYAQTLVDAGWEGDPQEFIDAAYNPVSTDQWDVLDSLPEGASLEGFLFPNTYDIPSNATPQTVIEYLLNGFDAQFTDEMRQQTSRSEMSIYEVVTLASIVEKEARAEQERVTISGLYSNRLDQGIALQADPTIQYVVGTPDDWWPQLDTELIEQAFDSPYNTYNEDLTPALPVGPIANPGLRAIQAVLNPEEHAFLFMQAKNDEAGTHAFTDNLAEHEENICTYNPDAEICAGGASGDPGTIIAVAVPADRRSLAIGQGQR